MNEVLLDDGLPLRVLDFKKYEDYEGIGKNLYVI